MKVLVTGSKGFVGGHLIKRLSGKDFEVFGIGRKAGMKEDTGETFIVADLENKAATLTAVKQITDSIDVIVHLAAPVAKQENLDDVDIISRSARISDTVAALALELGVSKLVHLSSMAVYPNIDGSFDEQSTINPASNTDALYGLAKFNAEIILEYKLAKTAISISHLRAAMAYGEGMNESRIIPVFEKEKKEKGSITIFGNGERMLNLVHVSKLTDVIESFVRYAWTGIYNVGDEFLSLGEIADRINADGRATIVKVEKGSKSRFELNFGKLKKALNV